MPDVFISYKSEERDLIAPLARRLSMLGLNVWFDKEIRTGERWDAAIEEKLRAARVVVVCWSRQSVHSSWVIWEATHAHQRQVYIPVFFDECEAPGPLAFIQGSKLASWREEPDYPAWISLLRELERLLQRGDLVNAEQARAQHVSQLPRRPVGHFREEKKSRKRHRILAIGGGTNVLIAVQYVKRIEQLLRARSSSPHEFVLSDYFDLIGGTSVGAFVAAGLALAYRTSELEQMLLAELPRWRRPLSAIWGGPYSHGAIRRSISAFMGERTLDSSDFRTGLAICTYRLDTDNVWLLTNDPSSRYWNDPPDQSYLGNRSTSLEGLVLAAIANPGLPVPVSVPIYRGKKERGVFVDSATVGLSDPSVNLMRIALLPPFGLNWATGEDKLLMVSIGSGTWRDGLSQGSMSYDSGFASMARRVGRASAMETIMTMQMLTTSGKRWIINSELGSMEDCLITPAPLMTFHKFDIELGNRVHELGDDISRRRLERIRKGVIYDAERNSDLVEIGTRSANATVSDAEFPSIFDAHLETA